MLQDVYNHHCRYVNSASGVDFTTIGQCLRWQETDQGAPAPCLFTNPHVQRCATHTHTHGDKRVNSHWLPCPKILCMVTKLWPMSQGASHLERSDLKLFEDRGFRVLRVHDVTSSIVDTSCNNLPRYSTRRYVFLPDDIELRWRELCQRTSRPLHKTHSPSVFYTKCPAKP